MKHEVSFAAAFDKRDPNPSKNYGIHGVHIYFTVKDDTGGLTFSISTGWQLPHVQAEIDVRQPPATNPWMFHKPTAFGVDIHSLTPRYEGQTPTESCEVTGKHCYCDGSALLGEDFLKTLIEGGNEALFARMEQQYKDWS
jgi:hypothetical protein